MLAKVISMPDNVRDCTTIAATDHFRLRSSAASSENKMDQIQGNYEVPPVAMLSTILGLLVI